MAPELLVTLLGLAERQTLLDLRARAEARVVTVAELAAALERKEAGQEPEPGFNAQYTVRLQNYTTVTFAVEQQPVGVCRHVSILTSGASYPSIYLCDLVMQVLGFTQPIETLAQYGLVYMEHTAFGPIPNLIEPVDFAKFVKDSAAQEET